MNAVVDRAELERFRNLVRKHLGLAFDDGKLDDLAGALRCRLTSAGPRSVAQYIERLAAHDDEEWRILAELLTVSETYFFRYHDHFRAFVEVVLPACRTPTARSLRLLSAGASSGEEAYSLAILVRDYLGGPSESEVRITGIDVNRKAIERATRASYSTWSLRDTPADVRRRYFRDEGRTFELSDSVRSMVSFQERNLMEDDPSFWRADAFDVVFCRNVLMYLTHEAMHGVVARITGSLRPGGFLFLGHAETLRGISHDYHLRHTHDTFYYQRRSGEPLAAGEPTPPSRSPVFARAASTSSISSALGLDDSSWVDAIRRASERIATLADRPSRPLAQPSLESDTHPTRAETVDRDAVLELMRQERFAEALTALHGLSTASPSDPEAYLLRAVLLTNAGQLEEAEQTCEQLLVLDELSAGAHYLMALCREQARDVLAAIDHDQTATYLEPTFAMPHLHLGLLARRGRDFEKARAELERALALLPAEDPSRILLFGGGFRRDALMDLCRSELRMCEDAS